MAASINFDFFKKAHENLLERPTVNFQKLVEDPHKEGELGNYNLDDRCALVQYGLQYSDDPKNKNDTLYSGPMTGCHLIVGLLNDKSFMAHNNEDEECIKEKNETIDKIEENRSGRYYLFFTKTSMGFFHASPEAYIEEMEKIYRVTFTNAFYYDEWERPVKSWVEVFYNYETRSLQVSGFRATIDPNQPIKYDCAPVILPNITNSLQLTA